MRNEKLMSAASRFLGFVEGVSSHTDIHPDEASIILERIQKSLAREARAFEAALTQASKE